MNNLNHDVKIQLLLTASHTVTVFDPLYLKNVLVEEIASNKHHWNVVWHSVQSQGVPANIMT